MDRIKWNRFISLVVTCMIIMFVFRYLWWLILLIILAAAGFIVYGFYKAKKYGRFPKRSGSEELDIDRTFYQSYAPHKKDQGDIIDVEYEEHKDGE